MGGLCLKAEDDSSQRRNVKKSKAQQQVYEVDIVKAKLKMSRDAVNNMVKAKNRDIQKINEKIKQNLPEFQETGNKKKMVPLLTAKRDLEKFVDSAQVRIKLLNEKLSEVQMQQVNAETINALEDSNKYIKQMQQHMESRNWQQVVDEAKNKYQLDWPQDQEQIEQDPAFLQMWNQIGGNKLKSKNAEIKQGGKVRVQIPSNAQVSQEKRQVAME